MNFTHHHSKDKDKHKDGDEHHHKKFQPNCCCHDYPGHFTSVDCNSKQLNACKFMLGYDRTTYNPNMPRNYANNNHKEDEHHNHNHNNHNNHNHNHNNHNHQEKKSCNCK